MKELKDVVKYHRKEAGLSRRQLSEFAGVSTTFLSDLESGKQTLQFNKIVDVLMTLNVAIEFKSPLVKKMNNEEG